MDKEHEKSKILPKKSLVNIRASAALPTLKYNGNFCNKFFEKNKIATTVDSPDYFGGSGDLVYNLSGNRGTDSNLFGVIIDLLLQLRAAQSDQNVFVQNNTVVREQILSQLKNEILKVSHKLTNSQIKNLEVVSSNSFDEKTLTDILKSFLESSKKKSEDNSLLTNKFSLTHKTQNITFEKIFANYNKVIDEATHYKKLFHKKTKQISFEEILHSQEQVNSKNKKEPQKHEAQQHTLYSDKKRKYLFEKILSGNVKTLKNIVEFYGLKSVNESDLILPLTKLKTQLLEINILNKKQAFAENILNKVVSRILPSETELVNKIISKTKINEIKEKILLDNQEYSYDKIRYQNDISRIKNQIKKIYNTKNVRQNIYEQQKMEKIHRFNIESTVKKNIEKILKENAVTNKFETVYKKALKYADSALAVKNKQTTSKFFETDSRLLNRNFVHKKTNLMYGVTDVNEQFIKDVHENNLFIKNVRGNKKNYKNFFKHTKNLIKEDLLKSSFKNIRTQTENTKILEFSDMNFENIISAYKNINHLTHKRIFLKNNLNVKDNLGITDVSQINKGKTFYNFLERTKSLVSDIFENRYTEIIKDRIFRVNPEIPKSFNKDYMIYKQTVIPAPKEDFSPDKKEKVSKKSKPETYEIKETPKPITPQIIDAQSIEKRIMEKAMGKKEVVNLIESYLSNINVDSISQIIMSKVERKMFMDKRRNGIF